MNHHTQPLFAIVFTALLLNSTLAQGQRLDPAYLSEMPAPSRVISEIKGKDAEDTVERQMGAFMILDKIIDDMAFGLEHRAYTRLKPDETRIEQVYNQAYSDLYKVIKRDDHKYDHDRVLFNEVLAKLFSPSFRDLYFKSDAKAGAWAKANFDKMYSSQTSSGTSSGNASEDEIHKLCAAKGLDDFTCMVQTGLNTFIKATGSTGTAAPGLTFHGEYPAQKFHLTLAYGESAGLSCDDVNLQTRYSLERKGNQILITVKNGNDSFVLRLQPDGKTLVGPGLVSIHGSALAGSTSSTVTTPGSSQQVTHTTQRTLTPLEAQQYPDAVKNGQTYTINETTTSTEYTPGTSRTTSGPVYVAKSASCRVGALTLHSVPLTPPPGASDMLNKIIPPSRPFPDGLRMGGIYDGPGGASITFHADGAIVGCHETMSEHPYTVSFKGGEVLIDLQGNASGAQQFTLRPDGSLVGDGSTITLMGKKKTGEDALGDTTYMGSSDTCTYGTLAPRGAPRGPINAAAGNTTASPAVNRTPVPTTASTSGSTPTAAEPAVLNVTNGFVGQAANPLAGRELIVINQSFEEVLRSAGFQDPPGAVVKRSPVAIWADGCKNRTPMCKQGIDAMQGSYVGKIRLDATGRTRISGVPKGNYWIVGLGAANNQHFVWNLRLGIKPGPNSIEFDPRNAALIY